MLSTSNIPRTFSLSDPALVAKPYPAYVWLLAQSGPLFDESSERWIISHYAQVKAALSDTRLASTKPPDPNCESDPSFAMASFLSKQLHLIDDNKKHNLLRGLLAKSFTPRAVNALRHRIAKITDELLTNALPRPENNSSKAGVAVIDIIRDLALPLPLRLIAEMLGLPTTPADMVQFQRWAKALVAMLDTDSTTKLSRMRRLSTTVEELVAYLSTFLAQPSQKTTTESSCSNNASQLSDDGKSDLLLVLQQAIQDGLLTDEELVANCLLLIAAGYVTTSTLIGNGFLALLENPAQMQLLRSNTAHLIAGAVAEFMRHSSPSQYTKRVAVTDLYIGSQLIQAGEGVALMLGAANRDPAQFSNPNALDITRSNAREHLGFGRGFHYCLGAFLAQLEAQVAISTLLQYKEPGQLSWLYPQPS